MLMIRLLALVAILGLSACNTVQGVGRDITSAAQTVENAF
jgi:predicted small secreted protein